MKIDKNFSKPALFKLKFSPPKIERMGVIEKIDKVSSTKVIINKKQIIKKLNIDLFDVIFRNSQKISIDFILF
tara:strand:- start:114 stop:332 length:219 start_codon:yes stop_codon:yes gene_type:complete